MGQWVLLARSECMPVAHGLYAHPVQRHGVMPVALFSVAGRHGPVSIRCVSSVRPCLCRTHARTHARICMHAGTHLHPFPHLHPHRHIGSASDAVADNNRAYASLTKVPCRHEPCLHFIFLSSPLSRPLVTSERFGPPVTPPRINRCTKSSPAPSPPFAS